MFGEAMGGDALQGASDALVDGLVDFFPRQKAASLRRLLGEARKAQAEIEKRLMKDLDLMDGEELARKWLSDNDVKMRSGKLPASSD